MGNIALEYFAASVLARDLFDIVCGPILGSGIGRTVHACRLDQKAVVKFEATSQSFQNQMEWETWDRIKDVKWAAKWFAPCESISPCGSVLVQRRTTPCNAKHLPKRIPAFFTDLKPENWGMLDGRPVCHDYGKTLLMEHGMTKRMVNVRWGHGES